VSLARGAKTLSPKLAADASVAGWLCRIARNLSLNHRRSEFRRQTRERHAMEQILAEPGAEPDWETLRQVLDDAMDELKDIDYDAIVLRFFENRDFRAVGSAIGLSDAAAQKRVARFKRTVENALKMRLKLRLISSNRWTSPSCRSTWTNGHRAQCLLKNKFRARIAGQSIPQPEIVFVLKNGQRQAVSSVISQDGSSTCGLPIRQAEAW
jgi:RNA polymerase sigma factor (sigma-70 family)